MANHQSQSEDMIKQHHENSTSQHSSGAWFRDAAPGESQETVPSQYTATQEIMTQNPDLTQMFDEDDDALLSPLPPGSLSPILDEREQPWGRLLPCKNHSKETKEALHQVLNQHPSHNSSNNTTTSSGGAIDLIPRSPEPRKSVGGGSNDNAQGKMTTSTAVGGISLFGLHNLHPSDHFNMYVMGRSPKCDISASVGPPVADAKVQAMHEWAHAMISNRHCRIFCRLSQHSPEPQMVVEDCSGNGTLINRTTLLRKGQQFILHSGDEISLANPGTLRRKIRSNTVLEQVVQQHSFIFVSLWQHRLPREPLLPAAARKPKSPAVNVRAVKHPSKDTAAASAEDDDASSGGFPVPSPRRRPPQQQPPITSSALPERRLEEDYDVRDQLGSGTVGLVYRAIHRKTGEEHAVKRIQWNGASQKFQQRRAGVLDHETHPTWQAEVKILQELNHPYIVRLLDVYATSTELCLVMELLSGGDLFDRIVERERYTEVNSRRILRRILAAVHYLHQDCNIVHRDLKPENILMHSRTNDIDIQLTDFGLAKAEAEGLKTFCGTPQYFAPEVMQRQMTLVGQGRYGKPADMWSVGVILYVLLSGSPPFDANAAGLQPITFPSEFWHGVSDLAKDLVQKLLLLDPRRRYTVAQACQHEWILMEDGDTHTFPLDDPKLPKTKTAGKGLLSNVEKLPLSKEPATKPTGTSEVVKTVPGQPLTMESEKDEKAGEQNETSQKEAMPAPDSVQERNEDCTNQKEKKRFSLDFAPVDTEISEPTETRKRLFDPKLVQKQTKKNLRPSKRDGSKEAKVTEWFKRPKNEKSNRLSLDNFRPPGEAATNLKPKQSTKSKANDSTGLRTTDTQKSNLPQSKCPQREESISSRRVSDSSGGSPPSRTPPRLPKQLDRRPLSPSNLNSRPEKFRQHMEKLAQSETKSSGSKVLPAESKTSDATAEKEDEEVAPTHLSFQQVESIDSFSGDSRDSENNDVLPSKTTLSTEKQSKRKQKKRPSDVNSGDSSSNKKNKRTAKVQSAVGKQTTLSTWCSHQND